MSSLPATSLPSSAFVNSNNPIPSPHRGVEDERALLQRIALKDTLALNELYRTYAGPLYSYALKMLSDREDAEEVLQDAFVRIWKKAKLYQSDRSKPFTWSVMIVRGLALDRLRRRHKKSALKSVPLDSVEEPHTEEQECLRHLFFSESSRLVEQALQTLPPAERSCLEMVIFSQTTHREIAQDTQQPLGTIKARIRRGLIKLRLALETHGS